MVGDGSQVIELSSFQCGTLGLPPLITTPLVRLVNGC